MEIRILIVLLFWGISLSGTAQNSIKTLSEASEVEELINSFAQAKFERRSVVTSERLRKMLDCDNKIETQDVVSWQVVDLNEDGNLDLLVNGLSYSSVSPVVLIYDPLSENKYHRFPFYSASEHGCNILIYKEHTGLKHIYSAQVNDEFSQSWVDTVLTDDLIFRFGAFVEKRFGSREAYPAMEKIAFEFLHCDSFCPEYTLEMSKDGQVLLERVSFNPATQYKHSKSSISLEEAEQLLELATYITPKEHPAGYFTEELHITKVRVSFEFRDGTIKTIYDEQFGATKSLKLLYDKLIYLYENQHWEAY